MELTALMSVYNGERFIKETINSILNQSYTDFELLIVDDASTDNTVRIIESINDDRIRLVKLKQNVGVGQALKIGVEYIDSKYIVKVDSDDINDPNRFLSQKIFLDNNPDIHLVKSLMTYFTDDCEVEKSERFEYLKNYGEKYFNTIVTSEDINKYINYWCCIPHYSIMVRTETLKKIGYSALRFGEDYTLFYKLNKAGYKMATIEKELVKCRLRKDSLTANSGNEDLFNFLYDLKRNDMIKFISNNNDIYIWGTGTLAKSLYNNIKDADIRVLGFVDGRLEDNSETNLFEKPIYSRKVLEGKKGKIIIAANPAIFIASDYLESLGYRLGSDYYIYY